MIADFCIMVNLRPLLRNHVEAHLRLLKITDYRKSENQAIYRNFDPHFTSLLPMEKQLRYERDAIFNISSNFLLTCCLIQKETCKSGVQVTCRSSWCGPRNTFRFADSFSSTSISVQSGGQRFAKAFHALIT